MGVCFLKTFVDNDFTYVYVMCSQLPLFLKAKAALFGNSSTELFNNPGIDIGFVVSIALPLCGIRRRT